MDNEKPTYKGRVEHLKSLCDRPNPAQVIKVNKEHKLTHDPGWNRNIKMLK